MHWGFRDIHPLVEAEVVTVKTWVHSRRNIYLLVYWAASGLRCGMRHLSLQHVGFSLGVVRGLQRRGL